MAILLACAEDCDLDSYIGTVLWSTNSAYFRSGYTRGAFSITGAAAADPPTHRIRSLSFSTASSEFWASFQYKASNATGVANCQLFRFLDASNVCRLLVRMSGAAEVKLATRNGAGTITDLVTSSGHSLTTNLEKYDVYVKYANDGTGVFTLYKNGAQVVTYSGANTTDGATTLSKFEVAYPNSNFLTVTEMFVDTTDTRGKSLTILNSTTAGNTQQWTGTASNVNQNSLTNDAQYIYTDTANEIQQYKPAALPSGNWTVDGVIMTARAIRGSQGPQNLQFVTRIGSTDYTSASVQPDTAFSGKQNIQETNPGTSSAWISSDLADTNFQYGVKSIT